MKPSNSILMLLVVLILGPSLTACSVTPWVKPYERQKLADPIMNPDRAPIASSYMNHVYDAREGSRGADGSSGGGCGCN